MHMDWYWYVFAFFLWLGHVLGWEKATLDAARRIGEQARRRP